jgi:hypothetical protein
VRRRSCRELWPAALRPSVVGVNAAKLVGFGLLSFSVGGLAAEPNPTQAPYSLRWSPDPQQTNTVGVEVYGLGAATLRNLQTADWTLSQWQRLLAVYAEQGDLAADIGLPAMMGTYRTTQTVLRFEPHFPLDPGVRYRAEFRPDRLPGESGAGQPLLTAFFQRPARPATATTTVSHVYPSAEILPENLLKFYVHFSAPMSRGHIYDHIQLQDDQGKRIALPFLEIDEELWNPNLTRLTLFIDPGRIKRGVRPLEEVGPALEAGKRYTLVIDQACPDGVGNPLQKSFQKTFQVGPADRDPPDPARWKIDPPKASTREPLIVAFAEPMDHALAQRVIHVTTDAKIAVEGQIRLEDQERRWTFVPSQEWQRGPFRLVVQTTLEDLAGNNIGKPFDVDLFDQVQPRVTNATVTLAFQVR